MNRLINILFRYGLSALIILVVLNNIVGCKKDNLDLYQEVANEFSNYLSSNIGNATAMKLGDSAVNNRTLAPAGLPVLLESAASEDIHVQGKIDLSLLSIYDSLQHTKSPTFPGDAFKLADEGKITVESGLSESTDTLKVELNNATHLKHNEIYLIPIKLKVLSGNSKLKSSYMFVKMKVTITPSLVRLGVFIFENGFQDSKPRGYYFLNGNQSITRINGKDNGNEKYMFSARINHPLDIESQAKIRVNTSDTLQTWFEAIKREKYIRIPESAIKILKPTVKFVVGETDSRDSFQVHIDFQQIKPSTQTQVAIIELENTSDKNMVQPENDLGSMYAFITINIQDFQTENIAYPLQTVKGNKMDRSLWKVQAEVNDSNKDFPASNLFDGKTSTIWKAAGYTPQDLTIDLGKTETLKGFVFTPSYQSSYDIYYNFSKVEAYSSNDGKTWKKEGVFIAGDVNYQSSADNPDKKHLKFINPVTAKYMKFTIIESSFGTPYISEIEGIN
ncbi:discoidin domain-containing protein [Sphingobacterium sp.]|uniref:discoidin domain-containing protein n=1 Tax=Sphingobacterium sp. TaxID=341027 RepID=UPI0028B24E47|nr:discoidin domain-containing protein [Sphingobacterium sp.]